MASAGAESTLDSSEKKKSSKKKSPKNTHQLRSDGKINGLMGQVGALTLEQIQNQANGVGVIYDDRMLGPFSMWDPQFPEKPERVKTIWTRCQDSGLLNRCVPIPAREATEDEILLNHSQDFYDLVKDSASMSHDQLKELSTKYDSTYFHPQTYEASMLAAGSAVELTDQIVNREIRHGLAITRPPGHHSQHNQPNGYCIFNNVAIAAKHAVENLGFERVLIIDWDVHHGQGIQYAFYDDPRVLYFSIHRYELGNFWPNLRESDYDSIGVKGGKGFNINVPINELGVSNSDYLSIFQQILLPVANEFNPELVLVACGYDAVVGDPESLSRVTPSIYAHLTHMLKTLAGGRLGLYLEGGYCLKSQAEAVVHTLTALLGDSCPDLGPLEPILSGTKESILNVIRVLRPFWKCFAYHRTAENEEELPDYFVNIEMPKEGVKFISDENWPESFALSGDYEFFSPEELKEVDQVVEKVIAQIHVVKPPNRTCLVYDERMRKHRCKSEKEEFMTHPERPDRISAIYDKHRDCGLLERCRLLQSRLATEEELSAVHGSSYVEQVRAFQFKSKKQLNALEGTFNSIYLSHDVYECAALATGCTLNIVDEVMAGSSMNGVAIVRPPGHHAEPHAAMGFCYFNSVGVAARYAQRHYGVDRVLILDWDVHHGNGTQLMFENDPSVLYISIHRYDNGFFFPSSPDGNYDMVGSGKGKGFNINIPWNHRSMGDTEYIAAFQQIVMPVAYEFAPELVLVSAGFDAAKGDPLGGCKVSPACYGQMTHMLMSLAHGRVILVLEGGYNLNAISESMAMCTSVLLGDTCPYVHLKQPCDSAIQTLCQVLDTHQTYWKSLQYRVRMPQKEATKDWLKATACTRPWDNFNDSSSSTPRTPSSDDGVAGSLDDEVAGSLDDDVATCTQGEVKRENEESEEPLAPTEEDDIESLTTRTKKLSVDPETVAVVEGVACDEINTGSPGDVTTEAAKEEELIGACGGADPININQGALEVFSVVPLPWCPHLKLVAPLPPPGLDTLAPCLECGNVGENWICLTCYEVHCSRYVNEHMLFHGLETEHRMVLSYADLSVWCYGCDSYVHNEVLMEAKEAAHLHKFGMNIAGM